jgi:hypothetical protein
VKSLEKICFPLDAWPLLDIIGVLSLPNIIRLKASCANEMVGFVAADVRHSEKISWIATIGVLPEYRGQASVQPCWQPAKPKSTPFIRLCVAPQYSSHPDVSTSGYFYRRLENYYQGGRMPW